MPDYNWLDKVMQPEHVIKVGPDLAVTVDVPGVYAPESWIDTDDDGQILAVHETAWRRELAEQGWEVLDGFSGQYGYSGPIMHPSEYIGGKLAEHILDEPGLYAVVIVETLDDSEEPAGWAVVHRDIEVPVEAYRCPCCGDDVMDTRPICSACALAECERSNDSAGERDYWRCQCPGADES